MLQWTYYCARIFLVIVKINYTFLRILKVKVTLRLTVGQSVSLGVEHHLGLMTRYLLFDSYGLVSVENPL
jgi:hypothetical protein